MWEKEKADWNAFMRKGEEKKLEAAGKDNYFKDIHSKKKEKKGQ